MENRRWLRRVTEPLHALRNALDFPLRGLFRWRRRGLQLHHEDKADLFAELPLAERPVAEAIELRLREGYRLADFAADSSRVNYRANLFYLELLESLLERLQPRLADPLAAVDIGPSHWFYVQALYRLLRYWRAPAGREVELSGYEADPWRVYGDLHSRHDHAVAHLRGLPARYYDRPFEARPGGYDLALMLLPFVFVGDHLRWGLPRRRFAPEDLLQAAWSSVRPGGLLVIVNQGEAEHLAQRARMEQGGIPVHAAVRHDSLLYAHPHPRYALAAHRQPSDGQSSAVVH